MRRMSARQWTTTVFVLVSLNCLVVIVLARLIINDSRFQPERPEAAALPTAPDPLSNTDPSISSTRTVTRPAPEETPVPPTATLTPTPHIIYATATFTPVPSDTPTPLPTRAKTGTATSALPVKAILTPSPTPTATMSVRWTLQASGPVLGTPEAGPYLEIRAVSRGDTSLTMHWSGAPGHNYDLHSDMGTGLGLVVLKRQVPDGEYTDRDLSPGTTYRYVIEERASEDDSKTGIVRGEITASTTGKATRPTVVLRFHTPRLTSSSAHPVSADTAPSGTARVRTDAGDTPVVTVQPPLATPLPADTVLLSLLSSTDHYDDLGNVVIVGEIRNDSPRSVTDAQVVVTFYDAHGGIIQRERTQPLLTLLASHERSPFVLSVPKPANLWEWSLQATAHPARKERPSHLVLVESRAGEDDAGFYHVTGSVRNKGDSRVSLVQVVVTLYDRSGRPINAGFAYTQPYALGANEDGSFDCTFSYYPRVRNHTVQVDWD